MLFLASLLLAAFLLWTWRQNELFCLSVREGKVIVLRGRLPPELFSDLEDVLQDVTRANVHVQKRGSAGRLVATGVTAAQLQQLRNVFGTYAARKGAHLRNAKPASNRTLGQVLGIEWLAWWQRR
jgi:Protein of unknown function (DUF3634)